MQKRSIMYAYVMPSMAYARTLKSFKKTIKKHTFFEDLHSRMLLSFNMKTHQIPPRNRRQTKTSKEFQFRIHVV